MEVSVTKWLELSPGGGGEFLVLGRAARRICSDFPPPASGIESQPSGKGP